MRESESGMNGVKKEKNKEKERKKVARNKGSTTSYLLCDEELFPFNIIIEYYFYSDILCPWTFEIKEIYF